jgi:hypothetical protein
MHGFKDKIILHILFEHHIRYCNLWNRLLVYADDVNLLGDNIYTIEKNTVALIGASKEVGLEVNAEKTKYVGESNENRKTEIKIRNIALLSYKLADMLPML